MSANRAQVSIERANRKARRAQVRIHFEGGFAHRFDYGTASVVLPSDVFSESSGGTLSLSRWRRRLQIVRKTRARIARR